MAEEQGKQQPEEFGSGKASTVSKAKSKIVSQGLLERAQTRKWLLYGGAACLVVWLVASKAISERNSDDDRAPPPPEFVDTSPNTREGEEITIARLQRQLRDANEQIAQQRERQEQRDEEFMEQLESIKSSMETEREAMQTTMAELRESLVNASDSDLSLIHI